MKYVSYSKCKNVLVGQYQYRVSNHRSDCTVPLRNTSKILNDIIINI